MNYNELKQIADSKKIEVREIANELEMTSNGFRESIKNETIQLKKLRKLCELLHIHPTVFFDVQKGVYLNNVHAQVGNNNKIVIENKDREIAELRERLNDKDEIIKMLREKLDLGIAATPKNTYNKK
ncbi:MAG: hypothetical protein QM800_12810 [Paludibacter sp.]